MTEEFSSWLPDRLQYYYHDLSNDGTQHDLEFYTQCAGKSEDAKH